MKISHLFKLPLCLITVLLLLTVSAFSYDGKTYQTKHWYDDAVIYCSENSLLVNYLQSNSLLQEPVTWAIFSQVLSDVTANYSKDLYTSETCSSAPVNWAKNFSIMDNSMSENGVVTRLDVAIALSSFFSRSNVDILPSLSTSNFSDFSSIPDNYKNYVLFVEANSLMKGYSDGTFCGNDPLSICQLAQILYNGRDLFSNVVMDKLFSLDKSQIEYVELQNGNTGNKEVITEQANLSNIVLLLNSFRIDDIQRVESDGWSHRIKLHFTSGAEAAFYVSSDSVTINNVKYISAVQHFSSIL